MSTLTAFNTQLERLVKNLIDYFPDSNDFKVFESSFQLLKQANPRKILELFKIHILNKYKQYILDKNERFFLDNEYNDVISTQTTGGSNEQNYAELLMNRLKLNWNSIDEKNKEVIWKYFQVLIVLAEK